MVVRRLFGSPSPLEKYMSSTGPDVLQRARVPPGAVDAARLLAPACGGTTATDRGFLRPCGVMRSRVSSRVSDGRPHGARRHEGQERAARHGRLLTTEVAQHEVASLLAYGVSTHLWVVVLGEARQGFLGPQEARAQLGQTLAKDYAAYYRSRHGPKLSRIA